MLCTFQDATWIRVTGRASALAPANDQVPDGVSRYLSGPLNVRCLVGSELVEFESATLRKTALPLPAPSTSWRRLGIVTVHDWRAAGCHPVEKWLRSVMLSEPPMMAKERACVPPDQLTRIWSGPEGTARTEVIEVGM